MLSLDLSQITSLHIGAALSLFYIISTLVKDRWHKLDVRVDR